MNKVGVVDLSNLHFKWFFDDSSDYNTSEILGAWNPITPNTIYIKNNTPKTDLDYSRYTNENIINIYKLRQEQFDKLINLSNLITTFPIVMHELYHMLQYKTCPIGYIFMRLITVFTTIPYYLSGADCNNYITKFCKRFFWWDLEQQAETNGNGVEGFIKYVDDLSACFQSLSSLIYKSYKEAYKDCLFTYNKKTIKQATELLKIINFKRNFNK